MRVWLTGGSGMLGRALLRLRPEVAPDLHLLAPSRAELDLTDRRAVAEWLAGNPVDAVIHAGAKVGGIAHNIADPTGFLTENLRINDAVIMGAHEANVGHLIFLGSSCMYPRDYRQPLVESDILAAPLEPTNEGYALSKIMGARLCAYISTQFSGRAYRILIPCNLFGTEDHFGSESSHLIAAIVTKVVDARESGAETVEIWGSGEARREFLFADDLARFILQAVPRIDALPQVMNIGTDRDHSVNDYYAMIARLVGWQGSFTHDLTRPEGMQRKLISSALARRHGWVPPDDLEAALAATIAAYRQKLIS